MFDLTDRKTVGEILSRHHLWAKKRFAQHFLISPKILREIIKAAKITKIDRVLEVGPGIGTLTYELCQKSKEVVAVEFDQKMTDVLQETCEQFDNLKIIQGDILRFNPRDLGHYKVVANLPYNITSPVIRMFLETKNLPEMMVLMVQKEVAERICAKPPDMSLLTIAVQFYADVEIVKYIGRENFFPIPKVDSAIIKIKNIGMTDWVGEVNDKKLFFRIVAAGFSARRKQLRNNLTAGFKISSRRAQLLCSSSGIDSTRRAETLTMKEWIRLYQNIERFMNEE